MKQAVGNTLQESYSLEVTGPLLPHNVFHVCRLLQESQNKNFVGNFNSHEPSLAFCQVSVENESAAKGTEKFERNSRTPDTLSEFLAAQGDSWCVGTVKELNSIDGLYQWM